MTKDANRIPEQAKLISVASVHRITIPTELPLLVGEVSANYCG
jgi:hypothetical protein